MATSAGVFLTREEERVLLQIARDAMQDCVTHGNLRDLGNYRLTQTLCERHGVFVTMRCAGHLRGRAGSVNCDKPLAQALQAFAVQATLHDEEYRPVAPNETDDIDIEITVVRPGESADKSLAPVEDLDDIEAGRDGLYLERMEPWTAAVVLPQEARAHRWDEAHCLSALCKKASVQAGAWKSTGAHVYRFGTQVFSERHHSDYANW
ncbi:MAG: AmmeMemoRadiSam system protein A [Candidatus Hydrogenedentes bacterium]|nr:AmmeMemoRadiSam system protein A [Candidatus Hydrogenedentota bacterium]